MPAMSETDEISLHAVARILDASGFVTTIGDAPVVWYTDEPRSGLWVQAATGDGQVAVVVENLAPGPQPGTWREVQGRAAAGSVPGYRVTFHERPLGSGYGDAAAFCTVLTDEVISTVRAWTDWERIWSVDPVVEPAGRRAGRLRRLAASKLDPTAVPIDVDIDPLMLGFLDARRAEQLSATLDDLFLPGIRWHFPRDKTGAKFAARAQVLLWEYAPPAHPAGKGVWLVVDGPLPRTDPRLTIRLARAVGKAMPHRWDSIPEYWRYGPRSVEEVWGLGDRTSAAMAAEITDTLLAGHALEALAMCGIGVDRSTSRLLAGLPDRFGLREWTDMWVTNAVGALAGSAPWRWRGAVAPKRRPQRLVSLGGFNSNRRPGLFLEYRGDRPYLSFDQSASLLVAPRVTWQRDPDYDLIRAGLLTRERIPTSPNAPTSGNVRQDAVRR
jgi:hypothetical protein